MPFKSSFRTLDSAHHVANIPACSKGNHVKPLIDLVGKALLPAALVFCAFKLSTAVHEGVAAMHEGAEAGTQIAAAVDKGSNTASTIARDAPKIAGESAHAAGEGFVKGAAN